MKKILLALTAGLVLSIAAMTPAMADTKVGVIDLQVLLPKLPEMQQINDNLKKTYGDREKQIMKDLDDYNRNSAVMSAKDKQAAQQKLRQSQDAFEHDFVTARDSAIKDLMNSLKAVVQKVAAQDKYNLILISAGVAYADPGLDVTNEVENAWKNRNK
ncbi:MAG TPA: OmpH family outer membrane protein [Gammaproteobacteria bacterium]|nr:OmpH family outer membrane protein [Gammaproteobacteria bacterium]